MNSNQKFQKFLESLKGSGQDNLIESVKKGFQVCIESDWRADEEKNPPNSVTTKDGIELKEGDKAFSTYTNSAGIIKGPFRSGDYPNDPWPTLYTLDGTRRITHLNGRRLFSYGYAKSKGWIDEDGNRTDVPYLKFP